jgi:hypothetical protein
MTTIPSLILPSFINNLQVCLAGRGKQEGEQKSKWRGDTKGKKIEENVPTAVGQFETIWAVSV